MVLWISVTMALTPAELATAAEAAYEQLETCATTGCAPDTGAHAAFIAAVHRYQDEGVADGRLAATVRYLDPTLFADLPDVVRDAASSPWPWATQTLSPRQRMPEALFDRGTPFACPESTRRADRYGIPVSVAVTDAISGAPVSQGTVTFPGEGDRHQVSTQSGVWTGSLLYLDHLGEEVKFTPGCELRFDVAAPGFRPQSMVYMLPKGRKQQIDVALEPFDLASDGTPEAEMAVDALATWNDRIAHYMQKPSDARFDVVDLARLETAVAAKAWMNTGGGTDARDLCLTAGTKAYCDGEGSEAQ